MQLHEYTKWSPLLKELKTVSNWAQEYSTWFGGNMPTEWLKFQEELLNSGKNQPLSYPTTSNLASMATIGW